MGKIQVRAVSYLRTSRKTQRFTQQRVTTRAYARECGWKIVRECEDHGRSGALPIAKRAGLCCALEMLERGKADVLLVEATDRLARDMSIAQSIRERVANAGAVIQVARDEVGMLLDVLGGSPLLRQLLDHAVEQTTKGTR